MKDILAQALEAVCGRLLKLNQLKNALATALSDETHVNAGGLADAAEAAALADTPLVPLAPPDMPATKTPKEIQRAVIMTGVRMERAASLLPPPSSPASGTPKDRILSHLATHGPTTPKDLRAALALGENELKYAGHVLRKLKAITLIGKTNHCRWAIREDQPDRPVIRKSRSTGGRRQPGGSPPKRAGQSKRGNVVKAHILEVLATGPMSPKEVGRACNMTPETAGYHLRNLLKDDVVTATGTGNSRQFALAQPAAPSQRPPDGSPDGSPERAAQLAHPGTRPKSLRARLEEVLPTLEGEFHAGTLAEAVATPETSPTSLRIYTDSAAVLISELNAAGKVERVRNEDGKVYYRKL